MPGNTYTWTCPRCKYQQSSGTPMAPDNCPRCNYPDEATGPIEGDPNVDLEAEVGPEAALLQADPESPTLTPEQVEQAGLAQGQFNRPVLGSDIDHGWLAECMREVVEPYARKAIEDEATAGESENGWDWGGMADAVVERYMGDRPTLLCGCKAGTHGRTFRDIEQAHPERTHG